MIPRLMARVNPSGTQEIMIRPLGTDKIEVTIPEVEMDEAMRIWQRLTRAGHLQFRILADERFHPSLIQRTIALIKEGVNDNIVHEAVPDHPADNQTGDIVGKWFELGRENKQESGVLPFRFHPQNTNLVRNGSTKQLIDANIFTESPVAFAQWCIKNNVRQVEILCLEPKNKDDKMDVEGEHISVARAGLDQQGGPAVHFSMTREGRTRMGTLTGRNVPVNDQKKQMAIISDDKLLSAPEINSRISSDGIIEGRFTEQEVEDLVINLQAGRLEVALAENPISVDYVESTIGEDLKRKGIFAIGLSFVLIVVFMMFYYRFAGVIACGALFANLLLVMSAVMLIKQPLTMTGLAGLVLTVGMAVDANVLIYERIREEITKGAALRMSIRNGFDRALSAIVDSNITTIFTAIVLYLFGSEQLKGFAVTLILGICTSMFTAIFCSRVFFEIAERRRWISRLHMMRIFPGGVIDFISRRRWFYAISLTLILVGIGGVFLRGVRILDNDLRGGTTAHMVFAENAKMSIEEVRDKLDSYHAVVNNEPVEFIASRITSTDFPDRVFKVDSNIAVPEGEPKPSDVTIDDALTQIFGDQLMKLHVDYDPGKLTVERLDTGPAQPKSESSNPESPQSKIDSPNAPPTQKPTSSNWRPRSSTGELAVALASLRQSAALLGVLIQEGSAPQPQDETKNDKQETQKQVPETKAETPQEPVPQAANPQQPEAKAPEVEKPKAAPQTPTPNENASQVVGRFRITVPLNFGQPISRKSLIDALVTAAEKTNEVTLDAADVTVSAANVAPDAPLAKSAAWTVSMILAREADGKRSLGSTQIRLQRQALFPNDQRRRRTDRRADSVSGARRYSRQLPGYHRLHLGSISKRRLWARCRCGFGPRHLDHAGCGGAELLVANRSRVYAD